MAITVIQQPQSLTFSGNIPDIIVETTGLGMALTLKVGATVLLSEIYVADAAGRSRVLIRDFVDEQLSIEIPTTDLFEQTKSWKTFTVEIVVGVETTSFDFTALKGGSSKMNLDCPAFMKEAWLTWQVQTKTVRDVDPEWLSYFAQYEADVKVKAWFTGGTSEIITLHGLLAGKHYSINVNFSDLREEFVNQPIYMDVWVENKPDAVVVFSTWQMRYVLSTEIFDYEDLFIFHNGLGGVDTIRFTGQKRALNPIEVDSALFYDEYQRDFQVTPKLAFEKNTGYFRSKEAMLWAEDFFLSLKRYVYLEEELVDIRLINPEVNTQDIQLVSYDFTFGYTRQTRFLALFKKKSPLIDPIIIGPGDEEFYLPPAISDFPQLNDPTDALFPVQIPGTPGWFFVTWTTLLEYIYSGLPAVIHNSQLGLEGGKPAIGEAPAEYFHLSEADFIAVQELITDLSVGARKVEVEYVITSDTAGTLIIGKWRNADNVLFEVAAQPIVFAGTPDTVELRWDVMVGRADGIAELISGTPGASAVRPDLPDGSVALFEVIWNELGTVTLPSDTDTPDFVDNLFHTSGASNTAGKYAKIMEMDLGFAADYAFTLDYGASATLAANKVGSLHVAFVCTEANIIHSPTVKITTVGFSEPGDFVLVQLPDNKAALFHHSTNVEMRLQWRVLFRNWLMDINNFQSGNEYEALPAGDNWPSDVYGQGVQTASGDGIDLTDPQNPVWEFPTPAEIGAQDDLGTDVNAAILGANVPSGTNPFATEADIPTSPGEVGAEPAFTKGNLVAGTNVSLTGALTGRLVGSGDVVINSAGGGGGGSGAYLTDLDTWPVLKFDKNYRYIHDMAGPITISAEFVSPLAVVGNFCTIYIKADGTNKPLLTGAFEVVWDNWINTSGYWNRFYGEYSPEGKVVLQIENAHQGTANDGTGLTTLTINFDDNYTTTHIITNSTQIVLNPTGALVGYNTTLYVKADGVNKPFWGTDVIVTYDNYLNVVDVWNRIKLEWRPESKAIAQIINT